MDVPHKHAEVIKAWANGAEIQVRDPGYPSSEWADFGAFDPKWYPDLEYRVKPDKKEEVLKAYCSAIFGNQNVTFEDTVRRTNWFPKFYSELERIFQK